jgi:hypothetical protein
MCAPIKATGSAGTAYGHVPGHHYHDVDVEITRRSNGRWRVEVVETWGSAQGYDEEHGRKEVIGRGDTLDSAVSDAERRSNQANISSELLSEAMSEAADESEGAITA